MAAQHWLVKTEPNTYSFADLQRDGRTVWDGVRNPAAAQRLKGMSEGDEVFVYHSGDDKAVVGLAKVARTAFPDPGDSSGRWVAVELAAGRALKRPVTLAEMKSDPSLSQLEVLRQGRLSVAQVGDEEWRTILRLSES